MAISQSKKINQNAKIYLKTVKCLYFGLLSIPKSTGFIFNYTENNDITL